MGKYKRKFKRNRREYKKKDQEERSKEVENTFFLFFIDWTVVGEFF